MKSVTTEAKILVFSKNEWLKMREVVGFTVEQIEAADKDQIGEIGYYDGARCLCAKFIDDKDWALVVEDRMDE